MESDVCTIGSGISAAMVADRLSRTTNKTITVVEAGDGGAVYQRAALRQRSLDYGESPWPNDYPEGLRDRRPMQSRSMLVGGLAMHWGGVTPRFTPEDFATGAALWPGARLADRVLGPRAFLPGIGGDTGSRGRGRTERHRRAHEAVSTAGAAADVQPRPPQGVGGVGRHSHRARRKSAKNSIPYKGRAQCCRNDTCSPICPIGAKYSPDFT